MPKPEIAKTLRLFRVSSYITGCILIVVMALWYARRGLGQELWALGPNGLLSFEPYGAEGLGLPQGQGFSLFTVILIVHGWLYVLYLYTNFRLWVELQWGIGRFLLIALGGVVPFLSFFTERHYQKVAKNWPVSEVGKQ